MTLKKRLETFVQGWLPKEPNVSKAPAKIDFRINQRPLITNQTGVGTRSTRFLRAGAIFWVIFGPLFIIQFTAQSHIALTSQITWIIAGLTVGLILGALFTRRQLKRLAKDNEVRETIAGILFLVGTLLIFIGILIGVLFSNLPILIRIGFLSSVFAGGPAFIGARYILFVRWEKKNKMYILQNRSRFFAVPQSGTNSAVNEVVSSEKCFV
jgi:MFS family permease